MLNPFSLSRTHTNSNHTLLLLAAFMGSLYLLPTMLMPSIVEFLTNQEDAVESTGPSGSNLRQMALLYCNTAVCDRMEDSSRFEFPNSEYRFWDLSGRLYLTRSQFPEEDASGHISHIAFACHVRYHDNLENDATQRGHCSLEGLKLSES